MNTVADNQMLVLDAATRCSNASFFGLNPGVIRTNICSNLLGADTLRFRFTEWMIGLMSPSVPEADTRFEIFRGYGAAALRVAAPRRARRWIRKP